MNFVYNGIEYNVGTKAKIATTRFGEQIMTLEEGGTTGLRFVSGDCRISDIPIRANTSNLIVEIIEPIYPQITTEGDGSFEENRYKPAPWDIEIGWIWYIIIMVVGAIFKDRLLIWAVASAIFFLWKSGKLRKK